MKKKIFKIKFVIFDMDGVITDTMPYHYIAWKKAFSRINVTISRQDVYLREGQRGLKALEEIFHSYNVLYSRKRAVQLLNDKEKYFKEIVKTKYISGSRSFLKKLKKNGFKLLLVTGTSRKEVDEILPDNILKLFSAIVTGSDVRNGKPHPEPFLKALRAMKADPKEAIVIENAPLGIMSAKRAGLKCLAIETSLKKKYLTQADMIFSSFKGLDKNVILKNNDS